MFFFESINSDADLSMSVGWCCEWVNLSGLCEWMGEFFF